MNNEINYTQVFKAIGDETRLKIIEMLSCGEMCACDILEYFNITQPTLSYHMKILSDSGIVIARKEGSWVFYNNNAELINEINKFWNKISIPQDNCICKSYHETNNC